MNTLSTQRSDGQRLRLRRQTTMYLGMLALLVLSDAGLCRASAQQCGWDNAIGQPGMSNWVRTLAVFDDGLGGGPALYAGGSFTTAGAASANRIAKWDGTEWSPLGSGADSAVHALTVFDDGSGSALYAGGHFLTAGGVPASRIAKWDGTTWSALGTGMNGVVNALTVFDDGLGGGPALVAGGNFTVAGGLPVSQLAKWDGAEWSPLGSGVTGGALNSLAVFDDGTGNGPALYAGGHFTTAGGISVNRIAKWDGSAWSDVGGGVAGGYIGPNVWSLLAVENAPGLGGPALYAAGDFYTAGGNSANYIAAWDGSAWHSLGSGLSFQARALTMFDDGSGSGPALYVGYVGWLNEAIAKWNGSSWSSLNGGVNAPGTASVRALTVFDDGLGDGPMLCAAGNFTIAGGEYASHIAKWACPPVPGIPGDLNGDGTVGVADLLILLAAWGPCHDCAPGTPGNCPADLTGDCAVGVSDLLILLANWG